MSYNVVNNKISVKKRVERESVCVKREERSHQLNCVCMYVCMYVKLISITKKWSGQELLCPKFF